MKKTRKKSSLADKLVQKVQLALDGETWPIVVTHNVLIEAEELTGLNFMTGEVNLMRPSAKLMRALLYTCLKRAGAEYTLAEVGDLIGPHNLTLIQESLLAAWASSMPAVEEEPAVLDPTPAPLQP